MRLRILATMAGLAALAAGCGQSGIPDTAHAAAPQDGPASSAPAPAASRDSTAAENAAPARSSAESATWNMKDKIQKTDEEWRAILTPEQYRILREEGTERAFTGALWNLKDEGTYLCAGCGLELFASDTKYDSGTGWPSFYQPIHSGHVETRIDRKFFMTRTEVHCARCGGHLGHVFEDGPEPTGLRYCINSASLQFRPAKGDGKPEGSGASEDKKSTE